MPNRTSARFNGGANFIIKLVKISACVAEDMPDLKPLAGEGSSLWKCRCYSFLILSQSCAYAVSASWKSNQKGHIYVCFKVVRYLFFPSVFPYLQTKGQRPKVTEQSAMCCNSALCYSPLGGIRSPCVSFVTAHLLFPHC